MKVGDIRMSMKQCSLDENKKVKLNYFIVTELGIDYNDMLLVFKELERNTNALNIKSKRYYKEAGLPVIYSIYGEALRENGECDGILKAACFIPSHMKNYRLAILQEQKKILNILRSKIECRKNNIRKRL